MSPPFGVDQIKKPLGIAAERRRAGTFQETNQGVNWPSFRLSSVCQRFQSLALTLSGHTDRAGIAAVLHTAMERPTETHAGLWRSITLGNKAHELFDRRHNAKKPPVLLQSGFVNLAPDAFNPVVCASPHLSEHYLRAFLPRHGFEPCPSPDLGQRAGIEPA